MSTSTKPKWESIPHFGSQSLEDTQVTERTVRVKGKKRKVRRVYVPPVVPTTDPDVLADVDARIERLNQLESLEFKRRPQPRVAPLDTSTKPVFFSEYIPGKGWTSPKKQDDFVIIKPGYDKYWAHILADL